MSTSSSCGQGEDALLEIVERIEAGESLNGIRGRRLQGGRQDRFQRAAPAAADSRTAAEGLSSGRFRRLSSGSAGGAGRCTLRVSPVPTIAATAPTTASMAASGMRSSPEQVVEETSRPGRPLRPRAALDRGRQFSGGSRARAWVLRKAWCAAACKFDWSIQASTNLVSRFSVEELKLLRRSGLTQMSQGADTRFAQSDAPDEQGFSEARDHLRRRREAARRPAFARRSI